MPAYFKTQQNQEKSANIRKRILQAHTKGCEVSPQIPRSTFGATLAHFANGSLPEAAHMPSCRSAKRVSERRGGDAVGLWAQRRAELTAPPKKKWDFQCGCGSRSETKMAVAVAQIRGGSTENGTLVIGTSEANTYSVPWLFCLLASQADLYRTPFGGVPTFDARHAGTTSVCSHERHPTEAASLKG